MFPLPTTQRVFSSWKTFGDWARQNLFVTWVLSASGAQIVGIRANVSQDGTTHWYGGQPATLFTVRDPMAAFIGGTSGTVKIGATTYCMDRLGCSNANPNTRSYLSTTVIPILLSTVNACSADGLHCQQSETWETHFFPVSDIGADIEVTRGGGFRRQEHFCWKNGFIPWVCVRRSGSNQLALAGSWHSQSPLAPLDIPASRVRNNAISLTKRFWSFSPSVRTIEDDITGVCAAQELRVGAAFTPIVRARTGSGSRSGDHFSCPTTAL